jgi:hypothetical protein
MKRSARNTAPGEEELKAKQTVTELYEVLAADEGNTRGAPIDAAAFCELMSKGAQAQTIHYAKAFSGLGGEWDCEKAVGLLAAHSKLSGGFARAKGTEVVGVNTEGGRATATVRFGDGPITSLPLVREGGQWKLATSPSN